MTESDKLMIVLSIALTARLSLCSPIERVVAAVAE